MKPEQVKKMMPIIQAFADGKAVEVYNSHTKVWVLTHHLSFTDDPENYRIKPEPKKLWAIVCDQNGLVVSGNADQDKITKYYNEFWKSIKSNYTYSLEEYIQVV